MIHPRSKKYPPYYSRVKANLRELSKSYLLNAGFPPFPGRLSVNLGRIINRIIRMIKAKRL